MESAVDILSSLEDNIQWIDKNYDKLQKKLNNEWVAVLNSEIIDHDPDLRKLVKRLRKRHSKQYNRIAVEYVSAEELDIIL